MDFLKLSMRMLMMQDRNAFMKCLDFKIFEAGLTIGLIESEHLMNYNVSVNLANRKLIHAFGQFLPKLLKY